MAHSPAVKSLRRRLGLAVNAEFKDAEERSRFQHYTLLFLLGLPTTLMFGVFHLISGDTLLTLVLFTSAFGLTLGWLCLRKAPSGRSIYRWNVAIYLTLLLYLLILGGDEGSKALWMFTVPMVTIFLLGKREGLAWSAAVLGLSLTVFLLAGQLSAIHSYTTPFEARFLLVYLFITAISCWFEHLRQSYRQGMEDQNRTLEAEHFNLRAMIMQLQLAEQEKADTIHQLQLALAEVDTLRGLLPMCANCRKIRNDNGFWKHLENYLEDHASIRFTHGLCPECIENLYPDLDLSPPD